MARTSTGVEEWAEAGMAASAFSSSGRRLAAPSAGVSAKLLRPGLSCSNVSLSSSSPPLREAEKANACTREPVLPASTTTAYLRSPVGSGARELGMKSSTSANSATGMLTSRRMLRKRQSRSRRLSGLPRRPWPTIASSEAEPGAGAILGGGGSENTARRAMIRGFARGGVDRAHAIATVRRAASRDRVRRTAIYVLTHLTSTTI